MPARFGTFSIGGGVVPWQFSLELSQLRRGPMSHTTSADPRYGSRPIGAIPRKALAPAGWRPGSSAGTRSRAPRVRAITSVAQFVT